MPMDFAKVDEKTGLHFEVLRRWNPKGHEVALVMLSNPGHTDPEPYLYCECQYAQDVDGAPRVIRGSDKTPAQLIADLEAGRIGTGICDDYRQCAHRHLVEQMAVEEVRAQNRDRWLAMTIEDAIMDVFDRVRNKREYLGQCSGTSIYAQEVAELLERPVPDVVQACGRLFKAERLNLYGMILIPFTPMFRFPKELRMVMRYIIEEPLGWPNGEAGECFIETAEAAITAYTAYKSGKQVFWEQNYPYIAPHHLLSFGAAWLELAIKRVESDPEDFKDLQFVDLAYLARLLGTFAERLQELDKKKPKLSGTFAERLEQLRKRMPKKKPGKRPKRKG